MRMIRMLVLAFAATFSLAGSLQAQGGPGGPGGRGARMMEMLMKDIELSDVQKAKIETLTVKYRAEMPPMEPGTRPSPEAMAKRREIMEKQQSAIREVLTEEQQKVFDKNREGMAAMMQRRPGR